MPQRRANLTYGAVGWISSMHVQLNWRAFDIPPADGQRHSDGATGAEIVAQHPASRLHVVGENNAEIKSSLFRFAPIPFQPQAGPGQAHQPRASLNTREG